MLEKYFVGQGTLGYMVITEAFDEQNGGHYYDTVSREFDTAEEAEAHAVLLNEGKAVEERPEAVKPSFTFTSEQGKGRTIYTAEEGRDVICATAAVYFMEREEVLAHAPFIQIAEAFGFRLDAIVAERTTHPHDYPLKYSFPKKTSWKNVKKTCPHCQKEVEALRYFETERFAGYLCEECRDHDDFK